MVIMLMFLEVACEREYVVVSYSELQTIAVGY